MPRFHCSRPGNALASRLSGPPVSTATALPDHTVPRASANRMRRSVADATAEASHAAGANATMPNSTPTIAPQIAQRIPALRDASQACSAKVDSDQPVTVGEDHRRCGPRFARLRIMACLRC